MLDNSEPIYEPGEYCEVCWSIEKLGVWEFPDTNTKVVVCVPCYSGPRFAEWLEEQLEAALAADPSMEKLPDGTWRERCHP